MFKDRVAVITGASSGVGWETALLFAEEGARTILLARSREKLAALKAEIEKRNRQADYYVLDVSNTDQIADTFERIITRFGKIDLLINCAGFGKFEYAASTKIGDIKGMFDVNVVGLIACVQAVLPQMISQKGGHIVNVASIAGKISTPKSAVYSATKHAVIGFSNGLRLETKKHGIFVTVINPGPIRTPFFQIADPDGNYSANVARFMLDSSFVARCIIKAVKKKKREVNLPWYMGTGARLYQLWPRAVEKLTEHWMNLK
ncbi:SDR family NAD(P)-dependent oxidoreductase [Sporolactobacillus pectinivorans]|uniref:SDR family NAD(P)-dependent oxidoreductase n=1 Tax=Sporolactobacillus pectinivorans TaxID=1591408 RepID=UPI000C25840E|nr:SDR family oxidoreductase [Sporolactobacillus pectinivorans]